MGRGGKVVCILPGLLPRLVCNTVEYVAQNTKYTGKLCNLCNLLACTDEHQVVKKYHLCAHHMPRYLHFYFIAIIAIGG